MNDNVNKVTMTLNDFLTLYSRARAFETIMAKKEDGDIYIPLGEVETLKRMVYGNKKERE